MKIINNRPRVIKTANIYTSIYEFTVNIILHKCWTIIMIFFFFFGNFQIFIIHFLYLSSHIIIYLLWVIVTVGSYYSKVWGRPGRTTCWFRLYTDGNCWFCEAWEGGAPETEHDIKFAMPSKPLTTATTIILIYWAHTTNSIKTNTVLNTFYIVYLYINFTYYMKKSKKYIIRVNTVCKYRVILLTF